MVRVAVGKSVGYYYLWAVFPDVDYQLSLVLFVVSEESICHTEVFPHGETHNLGGILSFLQQIMYRDSLMGKRIGVKYAEGFVSENAVGVKSLDELLLPELA